jgi:hypothetical protein
MKKFTFVVVALGILCLCGFISTKIERKTKETEVIETRYVLDSQTANYISRLKPNMDPAIAQIIARAIDKECAEFNLDPEIVVSLIARESSFVPWAMSMKNKKPCSYGLMMVYPGAHPDIKAKYTTAELCTISVNVHEGCRILASYRAISQSMDEALGRYVGSQGFKSYKRDILANAAELYASR